MAAGAGGRRIFQSFPDWPELVTVRDEDLTGIGAALGVGGFGIPVCSAYPHGDQALAGKKKRTQTRAKGKVSPPEDVLARPVFRSGDLGHIPSEGGPAPILLRA